LLETWRLYENIVEIRPVIWNIQEMICDVKIMLSLYSLRGMEHERTSIDLPDILKYSVSLAYLITSRYAECMEVYFQKIFIPLRVVVLGHRG
jgi:hypothetical protein